MNQRAQPGPGQKGPVGRVTRGKTTRNRLRRVDGLLLAYDPALIARIDGLYNRAFFVDLGYGQDPVTTLESAKRLRKKNPGLYVLGVEIDPERVANAQAHADEHTFFRYGGFELPLRTWPDGTPETVRLVRAFNVLRQYDEDEVEEAYRCLFRHLLPGALLVEGTSDPFGSIWVASLVRKLVSGEKAWATEALVFSTNFRAGFDPAQFQAVLPKSLIHHMVPGERIHDFSECWKQAAQETRAVAVWGLRQWFVSTAESLVERGYRLNLRRRWLRKGYLIWENPDLTGQHVD